ncbi:MAG: carboxypeptidase-like regulatory domain-containing protein, partial [Ginsengibacter sp.]
MRKILQYSTVLCMANFFSIIAFGQNLTISGNVKNANTDDGIPAVSVAVKGGTSGTFTDEKGNFKLNTNAGLPVTLIFSSIGYDLQEKQVSNTGALIDVSLTPVSTLGQEVVVSATRTPSRILESPVTIERISAANIRNTAAVSYYDMVGKLKGVDVVSSSLTFSTPSTRGFNGSGNLRFN